MTFLGPLLFAGLMFGAIAVTMSDNTVYQILLVDPFGVVTEMDSTTKEYYPRFPDQFKDSERLIYSYTQDTVSPESFKEGMYSVMIHVDEMTINDGKCDFL